MPFLYTGVRARMSVLNIHTACDPVCLLRCHELLNIHTACVSARMTMLNIHGMAHY